MVYLNKLIDYQAQQVALTSILAFAFSGIFIKQKLLSLYDEMMHKINNKQDFSMMKELHSICSCMKALYTNAAVESLKIIREMCGEHGFLQVSGLPFIAEKISPFVTLEGDNYVMYQQTANTMLKSIVKRSRTSRLKGAYSYINDIVTIKEFKLKKFDPNIPDNLLDILKYHALFYISKATGFFSIKKKPINQIDQVDLVRLAEAHAVYLTGEYFIEGVNDMQVKLDKINDLNKSEKQGQMMVFRAL